MTDEKLQNIRPDLKLHDPNNLILIDGSGYIFRAFYGLPSMTNEDGIPVILNGRDFSFCLQITYE